MYRVLQNKKTSSFSVRGVSFGLEQSVENLTFSGVVNKITGLLQPSIKEKDLNPSTKFNHSQDFFSIEVIDSG